MKIHSIILTAALAVAVGAVVMSQGNKMNFDMTPNTKAFSGEWIVHSKESHQIILRAVYRNGQRDGTQTSWYVYPDLVQTEQVYSNGVLHGLCVRYDRIPRSQPLLSGQFLDGRPWNGTFLINDRGEPITTPFISLDMPDVIWGAARYAEGIEVDRGQVGPNGFQGSRVNQK